MAMAADERASMLRAGRHRYGEVTVAQVCYAALREFRVRTGNPDPGPAWEGLNPAEQDSMTEAVTVARALARLPDSRHAAPEDTGGTALEEQVADDLFRFVTAALTPA